MRKPEVLQYGTDWEPMWRLFMQTVKLSVVSALRDHSGIFPLQTPVLSKVAFYRCQLFRVDALARFLDWVFQAKRSTLREGKVVDCETGESV